MEHLINLNFAPGGLPATVHVSQYDDTIRQLRFQLWFGRSKVEVPSGASVRVDIKKPDGHIVLVNGTVNSSDRSIVTVPTTKQMTAVPGGSRGTLVVSSTGEKRISSAIFILQVHRDPVEDGDASDSDLSMLQDAIDQTAANASAAQAAATAAQQAASAFTTDTTLSVSGKAADAAETGRQFGLINESLGALEPGLSNDARVALLNCFAHVAWTDKNGKDYYDALEEALNYNDEADTNIIYVHKGVGVVDYVPAPVANRALSEPIPFDNETPITVWVDLDDVSFAYNFKFSDVNNEIIDNDKIRDSNGNGANFTDDDGRRFDGWVTVNKMLTFKQGSGSAAQACIIGTSSDGRTPNNRFRLLFANASSSSSDLPAGEISGTVTVQGVVYRLVTSE